MPSRIIQCPVCAQPMPKLRLPMGVDVDVCERDGLFLDRGELEAIVRHVESTAQAQKPGLLAGFGHTVAQSAARGAGWEIGRDAVSGLVRRLFG